MTDQDRWYQLTFAQQLGNIGSELARAQHWEVKNDRSHRDESLSRSIELLDFTLDDRRWRGKFKELTRLREVISDWFCKTKVYDVPPQALQDYCISFTLLDSEV